MKTLSKLLVATALIGLPLSTSADVRQYSLCSLNDGKTIADVQTWVNDWRELLKTTDLQYEIRILVPHAAPESLGQFFIEGSTPTLSTHAAGWEWWYSDDDARESNAQLVSAATCAAQSIYMTTD